MARKAKAKSQRRAKPLYFSAKISDYQFRKVVWHFTLDHSAAEAAKHVRLSVNSISAIYAKLRRFYFDYGLFGDPYKGGDPREGFAREGFEDVEHKLLTLHLERVAAKHGQPDTVMGEPDYHLSESNWRFGFDDLMKQRGPELVQRMMYAHLMEFLRRFGPVGARQPPTVDERRAGLTLALEQFDRTVLWMERNAEKFRDVEKRSELRRLRKE